MNETMTNEKKNWTPNEVAKAAGVSSAYIRRLLGEGTIKATKIGEGRRGFWIISNAEARRFLREREG